MRAESGLRLGVGVNYWKMLDDIEAEKIDEDGLSWLVTSQFELATLLKLEINLEIFTDDFQGIEGEALAPQVFVLLGSTIYGAAGVGILYADSEFADDPFYVLRAGLDLEIVPRLHLDLNVNYRFLEWVEADKLTEDIDADTMTLGVALRLAL